MKNLRILVIDTDLFSLSKIYFGLIHLNYTVEACNNLSEVEERVSRFQPGLVVLACAGTGDLASLCSYLQLRGVGLLLVDVPPGKDRSTLPVDGFLEKPVDIHHLQQKISDFTVKHSL